MKEMKRTEDRMKTIGVWLVSIWVAWWIVALGLDYLAGQANSASGGWATPFDLVLIVGVAFVIRRLLWHAYDFVQEHRRPQSSLPPLPPDRPE